MIRGSFKNILRSDIFKRILLRNKVKRIAVFGSYAMGTARRGSDVDFLVEFKDDADLLDQVGLKLELEGLLKKDVDITTPRALSRYFKSQVLQKAVYL